MAPANKPPDPTTRPPSSAAHPGLRVAKPSWRERLQRFVASQRQHEAARALAHAQRVLITEATRRAHDAGRAVAHVDDLVLVGLNDEAFDVVLTRLGVVSERFFIEVAKRSVAPDPRGNADRQPDVATQDDAVDDTPDNDISDDDVPNHAAPDREAAAGASDEEYGGGDDDAHAPDDPLGTPWRRVVAAALYDGVGPMAMVRLVLAAALEDSSCVGAVLAERGVTARRIAYCAAHGLPDEPPLVRPASPVARVVVHNDSFTAIDAVIDVLSETLELSPEAAHALTLLIHDAGRADVFVGETDEVMALATSLRAAAADRGLGLAISVEGAVA